MFHSMEWILNCYFIIKIVAVFINVNSMLQVSFNLAVLLGYLNVLSEYIDAISMQHCICIGDLAPAPDSAAFK